MNFSTPRKRIPPAFLIIMAFVFFSPFAKGQGWERTYGGSDYDYGNSVGQTIEGGFILVGATSSYGADSFNIYLIKIDPNGDTLWTKAISGIDWTEGRSIQQTIDGGYIITGYTYNNVSQTSDVFLIRTNGNGDTLWTKSIGGNNSDVGNSVIPTDDGGYIITGYTESFGVSGSAVLLMKTDSIGNSMWIKTYSVPNFFGHSGNDIKKTLDGGFILCGLGGNNDIYLVKTNSNGDSLWTKTINVDGYESGYSIDLTNDSGYIITGITGVGNNDILLVKTNSNGDTSWTKTYGGVNNDDGLSVHQTSDGGFTISGSTMSFGAGAADVYLIKTDYNGNLIWSKTFGGAGDDGGYDHQVTNDGGYIIVGVSGSSGVNFNDVFLIKTDSLGNTVTCNILGKVYNDINSNCLSDTNDLNLSNQFVTITPGNTLISTDLNGNFSSMVDTGTYTIQSIPPNNYWQLTCPTPPAYTVNFTSFYDTSSANDFGYEIAIYCPLLSVDISTWALRPCMQSTYTVHYCNHGTIPADSAYIEVEFDNDISPVSSTLPWASQNGNVFTFNIGNVGVNQCGTFYITVDVSCNAVMGSTHCIQAHIYPDSICTPADSSWDHSSMNVEGYCVNDSLACFSVFNTGDDMAGSSQYRIYENNNLVDTGYFQLSAGDSLWLCWPAGGLTIRLEADQRPGHPGNSQPNANVELCGGIPPGAMGFILTMPEDDADEFVEYDCREITASYDPNEKLVKPTGIGSSHAIDSTDVLEYQINFQNTGTDTAFRVVVRDTLSQYLDVVTVQRGAGSHPYTFRIYGHGILEWTFNTILLPDSNTNEPLSHGFVRFNVRQKPGNNIGTLIENRAAIYFDYNAPVITNTAFNTVWKEFFLSSTKIYDDEAEILVYPNPGNGMFAVISNRYSVKEVKIYNILGKEIYRILNTGYRSPAIIDITNQPSGLYIYKLFSAEKMIGAGKLVVE